MSMKDFIDRVKAQEDQEARDKRDYPFGVPERVRRERVEAEARRQAAGAKVSDFEKKTWGVNGLLEEVPPACGNLPTFEELTDAGKRCLARGVPVPLARLAILQSAGVNRLSMVPQNRYAAVIEALNKLEA